MRLREGALQNQNFINLDKFPIHQEGRAPDLARDGCAVIKGFLTQEGIDALLKEAEGVSDKGHCSFNRTNPYFTTDDPSLPQSEPLIRSSKNACRKKSSIATLIRWPT